MNAERWQALAMAYNTFQLEVRKLSPASPAGEVLRAYAVLLVPLIAEGRLHADIAAVLPSFIAAADRILKEVDVLEAQVHKHGKSFDRDIALMTRITQYAQAADTFARVVHKVLTTDKPDGPVGYPA